MVMLPGDAPRLWTDPADGWPILLVVAFEALLVGGAPALC